LNIARCTAELALFRRGGGFKMLRMMNQPMEHPHSGHEISDQRA
jgi:hypothetical protein